MSDIDDNSCAEILQRMINYITAQMNVKKEDTNRVFEPSKTREQALEQKLVKELKMRVNHDTKQGVSDVHCAIEVTCECITVGCGNPVWHAEHRCGDCIDQVRIAVELFERHKINQSPANALKALLYTSLFLTKRMPYDHRRIESMIGEASEFLAKKPSSDEIILYHEAMISRIGYDIRDTVYDLDKDQLSGLERIHREFSAQSDVVPQGIDDALHPFSTNKHRMGVE